jgi:hypothetical protein
LPQAKKDVTSDPAADTETGFAALEAKVEEMQVEAAIEAELSVEDDTVAASPAAFLEASQVAVLNGSSGARRDPAEGASATPAFASPMLEIVGSLTGWARAAAQFQAETIESFGRVRSPYDLLEAQLAYGQRAMEFYLSTVTRGGQPPLTLGGRP